MQVVIEAIKFNHDPNSATTDAFNIRRNETEVVHIPEWRRGLSVKPEDSPAAYARDELQGRSPTIRSKFRFLDFDPAIQTIRIRAMDGRLTPKLNSNESSKLLVELLKPVLREVLSANVLGSVREREVRLKGGEEFELFNLDHVNIASAGVSVSDIIWRWQFRTESTDWTDFATTTHRIYTVLGMPCGPWKPQSLNTSDTQRPWVEVLDYACRWADSATDIDNAATLVTKTVNGLGGTFLQYGDGDAADRTLLIFDNVNSGSTSFTKESPPTFDCTEFLKVLQTGNSRQGAKVNCDDCAAFVVSFANILGCQLDEGRMGGRTFDLKPHLRIGLNSIDEGQFTHHTVGWTGESGEDDRVFDACLQLFADQTSTQRPQQLFVPTNIRFGRLNEHFYRFRLAVNPEHCRPLGTDIVRKIGIIDLRKPLPSPIDIEAWRDVSIEGWMLSEYRTIFDADGSYVQSFWRHESQDTAALRGDFYLVHGVAQTKIDQLLERFQLPEIRPQEVNKIGDAGFAVPTNFAVMFRRGSFVVLLRNIGILLAPVETLARSIDLVLSKLRSNSATNSVRSKEEPGEPG